MIPLLEPDPATDAAGQTKLRGAAAATVPGQGREFASALSQSRRDTTQSDEVDPFEQPGVLPGISPEPAPTIRTGEMTGVQAEQVDIAHRDTARTGPDGEPPAPVTLTVAHEPGSVPSDLSAPDPHPAPAHPDPAGASARLIAEPGQPASRDGVSSGVSAGTQPDTGLTAGTLDPGPAPGPGEQATTETDQTDKGSSAPDLAPSHVREGHNATPDPSILRVDPVATGTGTGFALEGSGQSSGMDAPLGAALSQATASVQAPPQVPGAIAPAHGPGAVMVASPGQLPDMIAHLRADSDGGPERIVVQLDPPELGRVSIDFKFDAHGVQHVTITGETADAVRQLRNLHFELVQALERQGLTGQNMTFQERDPSGSSHPQGHGGTWRSLSSFPDGRPAEPSLPAAMSRPPLPAGPGLDIKL